MTEERQPWRAIARTLIDDAELAVMLMPNAAEVQSRVADAAAMIAETAMIGREEARTMTDAEHRTHVNRCLAGTLEAIGVLSAFMRGDPLPERHRPVGGHRERDRGPRARHEASRRLLNSSSVSERRANAPGSVISRGVGRPTTF
ncbi:hypothetical protein [Streptomyces sp. SP18BB07]|uniref:hypothetical protein n=1 Tax=Streptomyces sp. SP18BB07 TaxID=3002522 RepID=UPI002E76D2CE|nr:hypothetical protein [Streptomyces sp. SP18BB07]MEE1760906.1 hypothetical protein [Streptomyces sp. SP18BB07]